MEDDFPRRKPWADTNYSKSYLNPYNKFNDLGDQIRRFGSSISLSNLSARIFAPMVSLNDMLALFLGRFLPVDAILSYGSVRQDWKNKAVLMLKERALCCLTHGSRPSDWVFSFKQMFGLTLLLTMVGRPFGPCVINANHVGISIFKAYKMAMKRSSGI